MALLGGSHFFSLEIGHIGYLLLYISKKNKFYAYFKNVYTVYLTDQCPQRS
jgi:hypothetical protein